MSVKIVIDDKIKDGEIEIHASKIDKKVLLISEMLTDECLPRIVLEKDDEFILKDYEECIRFFLENKKTMAQTKEGIYRTRLTLKELEQKSNLYIRVSNSDIINLNFVKRLDLSFQGTIACELTNGDVVYVSRRNVKEFKEKIGLLRRK